jgi:hypothetical protein
MTHDPSERAPRLTRRTALGLLAGTSAAYVLLPHSAAAAGEPWPQLTQLGQEYLVRYPNDASVSGLSRKLGNVAPGTSPAVLLAQHATTIVDDYAQDRTVALSGWYVSRTEARIAAFWSLTQAQP